MATINLGAIKFNWKGAYNSGTSYAVDDVVSSGGNSYVCIQAHSNQAVGNATAYWNIMSSAGTNGTDGTDLTSTLTTQGDIVYRDGSGLARLGYGTAGQVLKTGGSGANPSWTTMSSDVVLVSESASTSGTTLNFSDIFSSTYKYYQVTFGIYHSTSAYPKLNFLSSGTSALTANSYSTSSIDWGHAHGNTSSHYGPTLRNTSDVFGKLHPDQVGITSGRRSFFNLWFYEPNDANISPIVKFEHNGYSDNTWVEPSVGNIVYNTGGTAYTGFKIYDSAGNTINVSNFKCYGYK